MIENELMKIWKSSANQEQVKFEKSRLMIDLQSKMDSLHRSIKVRDLSEMIAAIIVIPIFAFYIYYIPFTLSKVASGLIIFWVVFVVVHLRKAKKHKPSSFNEVYIKYLHETRDYLNVQKDLLDSVFSWYILPFLVLIFLFLLGFIGVPGKLMTLIFTGLGAFLMGIGIYTLNKRAVKKQLVPRLEKVNELIKIMEESNISLTES